MELDREKLFSDIAIKDWRAVSFALYKASNILTSDPIAKQALGVFESEFFVDYENTPLPERLDLLEHPSLLTQLNTKAFSTEFSNNVIDEKLILLRDTNSSRLISYANDNLERPIAKEILSSIMSTKPVTIANAKQESTNITATNTQVGDQATIKLFKSKQEENFFNALRGVFPTFHHYPNVSVSCLLDFDKIKLLLNARQKEYFFRAVVDCVIFDSVDGYLPKYFFELDSKYHDNEKQKQNDLLKNSIFEVANVQLVRIRAYEIKNTSVAAFENIIRDIVKGL